MSLNTVSQSLQRLYRGYRAHAFRRAVSTQPQEGMPSMRVCADVDCDRGPSRQSIERLPVCYRTAWAAAGVTRLSALFGRLGSRYAAESDVLGICVDVIWDCALHSDFNRSWLDSLQIACMDLLVIHSDNLEGGGTSDVEHAISAIACCLEAAKSGDHEEALRACSHVRNALDEESELSMYGDELRIGERHQVEGAYPLVELERKRQLRDLLELRLTADRPSPNVIRRLRDRAFAEAAVAPEINGVPILIRRS